MSVEISNIPFNAEIESSVLGAILLKPALFHQASEIKPNHFFLAKHKLIFEAMVNLNQKNIPIDALTVGVELSDTGNLDQVGGHAYLASLFDWVISSHGIEEHIKILRNLYTKRRLIALGRTIQAFASDKELSADQAYDQAIQLILDFEHNQESGFKLFSQVVSDRIREIELLKDREQPVGILSGFKGLDDLICGWRPGQLILVASRPGCGKTAFCLSIAMHAASLGRKVGIFELEMSGDELADRAMSARASINSYYLKNGDLNQEDLTSLIAAQNHIDTLPIYLDEDPDISMMEMKARARRLKAEHGLDLLVVDYMQLVDGDEGENRQQQVAKISRFMKKMAKELGVPLIAASQLSRELEKRDDHRPRLSDLRDSGALEQDGDIILFLYRPDLYDGCPEEDRGIVEVIIAKHRNGPKGSVRLNFRPEFTRFETIQVEEPPQEAQQDMFA